MYIYFNKILIFLCITMPVLAMEQSPTYPWYQAYKNPTFQKRWHKVQEVAAPRWHQVKDFVKNNKRILAIAAGVLGLAYLRKRSIDKIATVYAQYGFDLNTIKREYGSQAYYDFIKLGAFAYVQRVNSPTVKDKFMNEKILNSGIYKKLGNEVSYELAPQYEQKLRSLYGSLPRQTGSQQRFQEAILKIMN